MDRANLETIDGNERLAGAKPNESTPPMSVHDHPITLIVLGCPGSGKSTFVRRLSSGRLQLSGPRESTTCIAEITPIFPWHGRQVRFIDTPGFGDIINEDLDVLRTISTVLGDLYSGGCQLHGIIYLHRIFDNRMNKYLKKSLDLLEALSGRAAFRNMAMVTTMWDLIPFPDAEEREAQLIANPHFHSILQEQATLFRHNNTAISAQNILSSMMKNIPAVLLIQRELVDEQKVLLETTAGRVLRQMSNEFTYSHQRSTRHSQDERQRVQEIRLGTPNSEQEVRQAPSDYVVEEATYLSHHVRSRIQYTFNPPPSNARSLVNTWNNVAVFPFATELVPRKALQYDEDDKRLDVVPLSAGPFARIKFSAGRFNVAQRSSSWLQPVGSAALAKRGNKSDQADKYNGRPSYDNGIPVLYHPTLSKILDILEDANKYRQLLMIRGLQAQRLLDFFHSLLTEPKLKKSVHSKLVTCMERLSERSGLFPTSFYIEDTEIQFLGSPVAMGGFSDIFQARFRGEDVAVKKIRIYEGSDGRKDDIMKGFRREAILWGHICHRNIHNFYGIYRLGKSPCLISPWMENGILVTYLHHHPDAPRALLALDVACGLSYLHERNIIHGDLKGPNILVTPAGRARLIDFASSSVIDTTALAESDDPGTYGRTLRWQAPELFQGDSLPTKASDVYAWACVCYEIFTEKVPFAEITHSVTVMVELSLGHRPSRPAERKQWGPTDKIWSIIEKSWAQQPEQRPRVATIVTRMKEASPVDQRPLDDNVCLPRQSPSPSKSHLSEIESLLRSLSG